MYANQYLMYDQFVPGRTIEHTIVADTIEYAEDSFVDAKERLLDVRNWKRYCAQAGVSFLLKDNHGKEVNRRAHKGDHINIIVPGAECRCCVIDALEYDDYPDLRMEAFTMRLKPCAHDTDSDDDDLNSGAALIIERRGKHLYASFNTRNVDINGEKTTAGYFGMTDAAWNSLVMRFVD